MTQNAASMNGFELSHYGRLARAGVESAIRWARYFSALMRKAAARERDRRQLARLDARMLQDIGLEPFDVYYGWRGPAR